MRNFILQFDEEKIFHFFLFFCIIFAFLSVYISESNFDESIVKARKEMSSPKQGKIGLEEGGKTGRPTLCDTSRKAEIRLLFYLESFPAAVY